MEFKYTVKILIVGNSGVGKSCLASVLSNKEFYPNYSMTIGVDFFVLNEMVDDVNWKVKIWDTAGHRNFNTITKSFYKENSICFLVFDLSDSSSFWSIQDWIKRVKDENPSIYLVLIGNKSDLGNKVKSKDIEELKNKYKLKYYKISTKENTGIKNLISNVLKDFKKIPNFEQMPGFNINPNWKKKESSNPQDKFWRDCECKLV